MHPNEALVTRFYEAFARHDGPAMAACYHPDATFADPVFPALKGKEPGEMWCMLTERASDLAIRFSNVSADDVAGRADWEADYTFATTKRWVQNRIHAEFTFRDGLIATHVDSFDFWRWSRMALGPTGLVLGWTSALQGKIQGAAGGQLQKYIAKRAG